MAGYQKLHTLLIEELDQVFEEGKALDREAMEARITAAGDDRETLMGLYGELCALPDRPDFPYTEPTEYGDIQPLCRLGNTVRPVGDEALYEKAYGAWLGRCAGCALGQPVELWTREGIREWCREAGAWPLDNYLPAHSRAEAKGVKLNNTYSTRDNLRHMPTDDDIRYTVIGLDLMRGRGDSFDSWDVGSSWLYGLPFRQLCTAENQAYLNFVNVDENGPWGKPDGAVDLLRRDRVNTWLNPYREWIGAQIRIDAYGYACAGDPHKAAKLAHTDAYFSHVKNGVYGAMFFAALIAAAFVEEDIDRAIDCAMREIPRTSRFYEAMNLALEIADTAADGEDLLDRVLEAYKEYNVVHTINNAALCLAAIRFSRGDFETALTLSVMGGMDTDCNGATVGSVMGAFCGAAGIPEKWKAPLNDTLYSGLAESHPIAISELAKRTCGVHRKLYGGADPAHTA